MRKLNNLLSRLEKVRKATDGRMDWTACCPAHADRSPSLHIRRLDDGKILTHCFAGCDISAILGAIGLKAGDLYPDTLDHRQRSSRFTWHALDVLRAMVVEAEIVVLAADQLLDGLFLRQEDVDRLSVSRDRMREAARLAGARNV